MKKQAKPSALGSSLKDFLNSSKRETNESAGETAKALTAQTLKVVSVSVYTEDMDRLNEVMQRGLTLGKRLSMSQAFRLLVRQADPKAVTVEAIESLMRDDQRGRKAGS